MSGVVNTSVTGFCICGKKGLIGKVGPVGVLVLSVPLTGGEFNELRSSERFGDVESEVEFVANTCVEQLFEPDDPFTIRMKFVAAVIVVCRVPCSSTGPISGESVAVVAFVEYHERFTVVLDAVELTTDE